MSADPARKWTFGVGRQFQLDVQPGYRLRAFTGFYLHVHGSPQSRGGLGDAMNGRVDMGFGNSEKRNRNKAKVLAAVLGGSAIVTMGAVALLGAQQQPSTPQNVAVGKMTLAATTTEAGKDDTVEATPVAVPGIKGPAPLPVRGHSG